MPAHSSHPPARLVFSMQLGGQHNGELGEQHTRLVGLPLGGQHAELFCTDEESRTFVLTVDGIPQSQVSLSDPTALEFSYVRNIARVIDAWAAVGHPLVCVHLGAGALTLARYVSATRPGSVQVVVERERELLEAVLRELPLSAELEPEQAVSFVYGDARAVAELMPAESTDSVWGSPLADVMADVTADVTVIDLWAGAVISARVASLEFYRLVAARVAPAGVVAVNLLDGPGFEYSRGQLATLRSLFASVAVVLDKRMLGNTALGNVVVLASNRPGAFAATAGWFDTPSDASAASHGAVLIAGDELDRWIGAAAIVADVTACDSPPPDESHFNEHLGRSFFAS